MNPRIFSYNRPITVNLQGLDLAVRTMKPKERAVFEAVQNMENKCVFFCAVHVNDGKWW